MSFWRTFVQTAPTTRRDDIEDIKYHLTRLFDSEASLMSIDDRLTEVQRSNYRFGIEDVPTIFLGAFFWASKSGQYEDDYTPSIRILFPDNENEKNC